MNLSKLADMSVDELVSLKSSIDGLIDKKRQEEKKKLLKEFQEKAASMGLSLEEIVGGGRAPRGRRQTVAPKYRHPENPEQTWSGRGRKPRWIEEQLKRGKTLQDMEI